VGVKVILECCYLTNALKVALSERAVRAGAAFVKTSTGFGPGGAVTADVELLCHTVAGRIGVKAAGGIRTLDDFNAMLAAGASRVGTSAGVAIMKEWVAGRG
jgi:deoxyribose-phosphate aldolase